MKSSCFFFSGDHGNYNDGPQNYAREEELKVYEGVIDSEKKNDKI